METAMRINGHIKRGKLVAIMAVHDTIVLTVQEKGWNEPHDELHINPYHDLSDLDRSSIEEKTGLKVQYNTEVPIGHVWFQSSE